MLFIGFICFPKVSPFKTTLPADFLWGLFNRPAAFNDPKIGVCEYQNLNWFTKYLGKGVNKAPTGFEPAFISQLAILLAPPSISLNLANWYVYSNASVIDSAMYSLGTLLNCPAFITELKLSKTSPFSNLIGRIFICISNSLENIALLKILSLKVFKLLAHLTAPRRPFSSPVIFDKSPSPRINFITSSFCPKEGSCNTLNSACVSTLVIPNNISLNSAEVLPFLTCACPLFTNSFANLGMSSSLTSPSVISLFWSNIFPLLPCAIFSFPWA